MNEGNEDLNEILQQRQQAEADLIAAEEARNSAQAELDAANVALSHEQQRQKEILAERERLEKIGKLVELTAHQPLSKRLKLLRNIFSPPK